MNIMAVKVIGLFNLFYFDAGTVTFPFAYMLGDVLAEIWGYRTSKKVIILTFISNLMLVIFTGIGVVLPYPDYMQGVQEAYSTIYTYVPRIVAASLLAFLAGELLNAKVLVMMRNRQKDGRRLWMRTIGSSVAGYLIDSVLFVLIAFTGTCPAGDLASMILAQYLAKMLLESLFGTPLAYAAVRYIRRRWS